MLLALAAAALASASAETEGHVCIKSATNLAEHVDSWPKKPAPEAWVKVELGGRVLCKTDEVENNLSPVWDHCCSVGGMHQHTWYWFSVFDSDYAGPEADYLGSVGLPANSTAGTYELELKGGKKLPSSGVPKITIEIPIAPPPPPPPRGGAAKVEHDATGDLLLNMAKEGHSAKELKKWACVMSAKGLVETDFFPRVGVFKNPDAWVKIGTRKKKLTAFSTAEEEAVTVTADYEQAIQSHLAEENELGEDHADRPGSEPEMECATIVKQNTLTPDWSHCCDVTKAADPYFIFEVYDEDTIYLVNDYLGAAVLPTASDEGQYELEITGGYDVGTLNVLLVTAPQPPVMNMGEDCWEACGSKDGLCPEYCGDMGACCKDGWTGQGCPAEGSDPFWHSCVAADMTSLLRADPLARRRQAPAARLNGDLVNISALAALVALVAAVVRRRRAAAATPAAAPEAPML